MRKAVERARQGGTGIYDVRVSGADAVCVAGSSRHSRTTGLKYFAAARPMRSGRLDAIGETLLRRDRGVRASEWHGRFAMPINVPALIRTASIRLVSAEDFSRSADIAVPFHHQDRICVRTMPFGMFAVSARRSWWRCTCVVRDDGKRRSSAIPRRISRVGPFGSAVSIYLGGRADQG